ncbi:hypothetical protein GOP47_0006203 [Adiantum capillus-veneris]|uniref:Uncharacterized protein n=1 Tax=Adiantum capillus-veneris TaxID=13818 RepID=A0A9D4ZLT6_ADICA|nr:hypothetical protein GOP47_0006203 [Adiantum capillus-veneris]
MAMLETFMLTGASGEKLKAGEWPRRMTDRTWLNEECKARGIHDASLQLDKVRIYRKKVAMIREATKLFNVLDSNTQKTSIDNHTIDRTHEWTREMSIEIPELARKFEEDQEFVAKLQAKIDNL